MRPRHELNVFSQFMEHKLRANDHKGGWEEMSIDKLFDLMQGEVGELKEALNEGNFVNILFEAADVANYAMMIAWNALRLSVRKDKGNDG